MAKIIAYTDGSCKPNPGAGGYAALLLYADGREVVKTGYSPTSTNNIMELTAAITALELASADDDIEMVTDSEYLKKGITEWVPVWKRKGWKTAAGKAVLNRELWTQLDALYKARRVTWQWTRAHVGTVHNERVDRLANEARMARQGTSLDTAR